MRLVYRPLLIAAVAVLATLGLAAPAQAATVFTVWDGSSSEYYKTCSDTAPYPCSTLAQSMYVQITGPWPPKTSPITLGYSIENLTASTNDYTTPTTGTVVMPANQNVTGLNVTLVPDGVAEGPETFRVHLTSSSIGGNISDTGIGTIYDDGNVPSDCSLSRSSLYSVSITCTGRPPTQQWVNNTTCGEDWPHIELINGPTVTGNGTSTATCPHYVWADSTFYAL